jgi:hypothetical protein
LLIGASGALTVSLAVRVGGRLRVSYPDILGTMFEYIE